MLADRAPVADWLVVWGGDQEGLTDCCERRPRAWARLQAGKAPCPGTLKNWGVMPLPWGLTSVFGGAHTRGNGLVCGYAL